MSYSWEGTLEHSNHGGNVSAVEGLQPLHAVSKFRSADSQDSFKRFPNLWRSRQRFVKHLDSEMAPLQSARGAAVHQWQIYEERRCGLVGGLNTALGGEADAHLETSKELEGAGTSISLGRDLDGCGDQRRNIKMQGF